MLGGDADFHHHQGIYLKVGDENHETISQLKLYGGAGNHVIVWWIESRCQHVE